MRIVVAIARYDYGHRDAGDSYEYSAFFDPLEDLGHEVHVFDTFADAWRGNRDAAGGALLALVRAIEPEVVLTMLMDDELPLDAIAEIGRQAITMNWFVDDVWRFEWYSRHVAPAFRWSLTTSREAEARYRLLPGVQVLFAPLGFNPRLYRPVPTAAVAEVAFVGQRHGRRGRVIDRLRRDGFEVAARGSGWPDGRIDSADLAEFFCGARINLNFLEVSAGPFRRRGLSFRGMWRADRLLNLVWPLPRQMKARLFEIPACGAFQLAGALIPEAEVCFRPGEEIATATGYRALTRAIRYYLDHPAERERMAHAGFRRAASEHSYQKRLTNVFAAVGAQ